MGGVGGDPFLTNTSDYFFEGDINEIDIREWT